MSAVQSKNTVDLDSFQKDIQTLSFVVLTRRIEQESMAEEWNSGVGEGGYQSTI